MAAKKPAESLGFDIFSHFATDPKKEAEGVWKEIAPGARVCVARFDNRAFQDALAKGYEERRVELDKGGETAEAVAAEVMADAMAEHLVKGFSGLAYKGKPQEYSPQAAREMLGHKEFLRLVRRLAEDVENFRYDAEESAAKN